MTTDEKPKAQPKEKPAHAGVNFIPPQMLGALLVGGLLLHMIAPVELGAGIALRGLGALIMGLCFAWVVWCANMFRIHHTALPPNKPSTKLVKTGPYAVSRNPIYLAMLVGYFGIALMADILWLWLGLPVLFYYFSAYVIPKEERYLARIFTIDYMDYQRKVRRWI